MQLDYNPAKERFFARIDRRTEGHLIRDLMHEHGFNASLPRSTPQEAVLFTAEPYVALTFWDHATPAARAELAALHTAVEGSWAKDSKANIRCPADQTLEPFQRAGVAFAMAREHTLIGDQPGLGKTMQAICIANEMRARSVLVIVPANIRLQWMKRIREWTTMPWGYVTHPILSSRDGVNPNAHWTIVSYELASHEAIGSALAGMRFDLLILDEAHYVKNSGTRRTRAIFGGGEDRTFEAIFTRAAKTVALTGTPLPNRPREAFVLARHLCWESIDWSSEQAFRERFNPSSERETKDGRIYVDERVGHTAELYNRLRANFMVRREKHGPNGVLKQLKLPVYDLVYVEKTGPVKKALEAERLLDIDPSQLTGAFTHKNMGQIAAARRLMGIAMAPQAADYIDMLILGGEEKLVVFAWHIDVLNIFQKRFQKHGVLRIDGSTSAKAKDRIATEFQTNDRVKVLIGNMLSMGTGTDGLQAVCNHAIIAEPDWVPGNNQQAFDRLDRSGQKRQVLGDILVAPGSLAEKVLASALRKGRVTNNVLDERTVL